VSAAASAAAGATAPQDAAPGVRGAAWGRLVQIIATPRGVVRTVVAVAVLTVLVGMLPNIGAGPMFDQLIAVNGPQVAILSGGAAVLVALSVSRGVPMLTTRAFTAVKKLLARTGWGRSGDSVSLGQADLLRRFSLLPIAVLPFAAWIAVGPGYPQYVLFITAAAVIASWLRPQIQLFIPGGSTWNNAFKAVVPGLSTWMIVTALATDPARVAELSAAGLDHMDIATSVNQRLAMLTVPVVVAIAVVGHLIAWLRVGTLDELKAALEAAGASPEVAESIAGPNGALRAAGLTNMGQVFALLQDWRPRFWPAKRLRWRAQRLEQILPDPAHRDLLAKARTIVER
jgi:hypothetical protein